MKIRSEEAKKSFVKYLKEHPDERLWQSLLNWSELPYIAWTNISPSDYKRRGFKAGDTYYWEDKNK